MPRGKGPESYYTFSKAVHNLSSMAQKALWRVWDATADLATEQRRDVMIEAFELVSQGMGEVASAAAVEYYDSVGGTDGYKAKMSDWFDRNKAEEDVRWAMGDAFRGEPDKSITKMCGSMDKTVKGAARTTMTENAVNDPRKPWVSIQTVGDTCKYCRERAGKWYRANGGFADGFSGFHANCDCHVAVSFDRGDNIEYTYRSDEKGEKLSEYTDAYGSRRTQRGRPVEMSANYVHRADPLFPNAEKVKEKPGFSDYIIHSDGYTFNRFGEEGQLLTGWSQELSVQDLAELIRSDPSYNGGPIRLLACSASKYDNGAAQRLANILGVDVIAPTDKLFIYPEGELVIAPNIHIADMVMDGEWPNGLWRTVSPR